MEALVLSLMTWIGANTTYRVQVDPPHVYYVKKACLNQVGELIYPELTNVQMRAFYHKKLNAIYLREDLDPLNRLEDRETLNHELIHHIQYANNQHVRAGCEERMEAEAYLLGEKFLVDHGETDKKTLLSFRWRAFVLGRCRTDHHRDKPASPSEVPELTKECFVARHNLLTKVKR